MTTDLDLTLQAWHALQPFAAREDCASCECLQGALAELQMALEDLPPGLDPGGLPALIRSARSRGKPHACRGCRPCGPGAVLAEFYRERQRRQACNASQSGRLS